MASGLSLYHALPDPMVGSVLYPMNELRQREPAAHARARAKYEGREHLMELRLPLLDCLWNDVLHLSPVDPVEIVEALESAGHALEGRRFVRIDASELESARTVLFLNSTDREHRFDDSQWTWFDASLIRRHARLPQATRDYYAECAREGMRPRVFGHVPHVLFRGTLDLTTLSTLEV